MKDLKETRAILIQALRNTDDHELQDAIKNAIDIAEEKMFNKNN